MLVIYHAFPGLRPFGVSLLYAGYDPHYEFQLYHSDPSGNYSGWKATCIGANNGTAQSLLKQEYKDDISVDDAVELVIRVMSKTMDSTTLSSEKRACSACLIFSRLTWNSGICDTDTGPGDKSAQGKDLSSGGCRRAPGQAGNWEEGRGR